MSLPRRERREGHGIVAWGRRAMRWLDRVLTVIPIVLLLLTSRGTLSLSPLEMEAAPHSYPLATWEVTHFLGKWVYKVRDLLPGSHREAEARRQEAQQFMALADEANRLEGELRHASASLGPAPQISALEDELYRLREELARRGAWVEEILEGELSRILGQEGFASRIGMVFPPVDFAFDQPPKLLTVSPRGQIETVNSVLLHPQMELSQVEALEERIVEEWDLSALVEDTGGVSFYPSVMNNTYGLRGTLSVAAHEWLHQYLFFHPLGRNYRSSSEMSTLNETVANMAGEALGDMAYEAITGEKVVKYEESPDYQPPAFDFNKEMHKTRLRVDEMLAEGRIEEAESYMEERRQLFVSEGYYIRKLNQAYFAFHGTYADTPASVSPIHAELERVRENTSSIGEFIQTVARFGNYEEFKAYVEALPPAPEG